MPNYRFLTVQDSSIGDIVAQSVSQRLLILATSEHYNDYNDYNGNPQDCQPQNWLLVDNPEVGNSEYVHYSGLPTPIIHRNSGYNAPQPTLISTW